MNPLLKHVGEGELRRRFPGQWPAIGIRPTVDGRKAARDPLEPQVLALAEKVAALYQQTLRYPDGSRVRVVVFPKCIGGAAESSECSEFFRREGVGVSLTVTNCWCYGSETMDMDSLMPKAVWGFNGTERPGAVYLAALSAVSTQKGFPIFAIYGRDVQDVGDTNIPDDVRRKLLRFGRAGLAVAIMRGKAYLSAGWTSMGIGGSVVNTDFIEHHLGMRVQGVDMSEFRRRMNRGIFDPEEFRQRAMPWVLANCPEGKDYNPAAAQRSAADKAKEWETVVKMTMIMRDMMTGNPRLRELGFSEEALGYGALFGGFQGQRQWTDGEPNGDFLEAILNTSADWNGIRPPYVVATENDMPNGACMLFGNLLTNTAQMFHDVRTYWSPAAVRRVTGVDLTGILAGGGIHLINSGACTLDATGRAFVGGQPGMKPWWDISPEEAAAFFANTNWPAAIYEYFIGGGFSSCFLSMGGMALTMSRISFIKDIGPVMQIAEGWSVDMPGNVHEVLAERTNPTWPTTWFVPRLTGRGMFRDVYSVMNGWSANHGALSFGHIGPDLMTLAAMLRIPVVAHNVDEDDVFEPSAFALFGEADPVGARFRACQHFGPLY